MYIVTQIIILAILIGFSGFFSGTEMAFFSLSKAQVQNLVNKQKRFAGLVAHLKKKPQRLLITILFGNNLVNIAASILAASVVEEVKERAIELAKEKNADYLIIDTSPGTHCNVIQGLLDCEKIYAVTEPTPLGSHDLGLILELSERLGIPAEIVLNKSNVGDKEETEKIAKKFIFRLD